MREQGLRGATRTRSTITTRPDRNSPRAPDLVQRRFRADRPNELWVSDFTYVPTWSGFVYAAFIVDVFSRLVVGWRVASSMTTDMVMDALEIAAWNRRTALIGGVIAHSDAGGQGGINWSSQHLDVEVWGGETAGVDGDADGASGDAVAGQTSDPSRCRAGVLGQDRRGFDERGCCDCLWRVRPGWFAVVPRAWRHAIDPAGPVVRQVSDLR